MRRLTTLAFLAAAIVCAAAPLTAQNRGDQQRVPPRPRLAAGADTNDADA